MAMFTVRVELRGRPAGEDYDKLHEAMKAAGFSRTIKDGDGVQWKLPMAEYNIASDLDKYGVLGKAKSAAAKVGKEASVLVTESKSRTWANLDKVKSS